MRHTCYFLFALFIGYPLYAQQVVQSVEQYAAGFQEEKVHIHFDKTMYAPGETIWYKAYIMNAILPEEESKTIYFDFSDENGKLLARNSSAIIDGVAYGSFELPADLESAFVHIKSYTKWMLNFDTDFIYQKEIRILRKKITKDPAVVIQPQITFFPEGGDLIAGITNKVAFKMTDQYGRPLRGKGTIQIKDGKFVDSLRVQHDGMGYFFVNPSAGDAYIAKWSIPGGKGLVADLPAVQRNGLTIQIGLLDGARSFKISSSDKSSAKPLHVLGTMFSQPVFQFTRNLAEGALQGVIPVKELPSGILTITVFDEDWKPLSERITYVNNEEYEFSPEISVEHWGLNKRARNEILISVPDSLVSNLSVSVTDGDIAWDTSQNIISRLKLTSDLKGRIHNPAYYFKNNQDTTARHLDLVMLTNGWRRFNWQEMAQGKMPELKYKKDTAYMTVSGKIVGASPMQLRNAGDIILMFKQSDGQNNIVNVPIQQDGSFYDPNLIVFDTANIYYQMPKGKGLGNTVVQFMQDRLPPLKGTVRASGDFFDYSIDTTGASRQFSLADILRQDAAFARAKMLEAVTIQKRTKTPVQILEEKYASPVFQGDGYQFDLVNDPVAASSQNIFNYLQGRVAGLQINTSTNPPTITWRGGAPGIYVDEMQASPDMVATVSVADVAYIKVLRPPFLGAMGGANGAIAIYTRRGDDMVPSTSGGLSKNTITGYSSIRQFYSPDYSTIQPQHEAKDLRTTLYWNPEILTEPGNHQIKLTFYNNDVSESFRVVLEGMTRDGKLAHVVMVME